MLSEKEKRIIQYCKDDMKDMEFKEVELEKSNKQVLKGIRIARKGNPLGIVVYWDDISRVYGENYNEEVGVWHITKMVRDHLNVNICYEEILNWTVARGLVYKKVINYEQNKNRLENLIYRRYMDLAEVCYLKISISGKGTGTTEVTKELLNYWGISIEELVYQAEENMFHEGYQLRTIQEMLEGYEIPSPLEEPYLYVITNQEKFFGAGILTNSSLLKDVLGKLNGNYFILPSSIHEIILCPDNGWADVNELKNLVCEVNQTVVRQTDFLSDSVYYYYADTGTIKICEARLEE